MVRPLCMQNVMAFSRSMNIGRSSLCELLFDSRTCCDPASWPVKGAVCICDESRTCGAASVRSGVAPGEAVFYQLRKDGVGQAHDGVGVFSGAPGCQYRCGDVIISQRHVFHAFTLEPPHL